MQSFIAVINGKTVKADSGGIYRPGEGYRYWQPSVAFYPEGGRGHTLVLENVGGDSEPNASEVGARVLVDMGFKIVPEFNRVSPAAEFRYPLDENGNIPYWPYCPKCHLPMAFDHDGPFASCACGTGEWGNPRPAPYVLNPLNPANPLT